MCARWICRCAFKAENPGRFYSGLIQALGMKRLSSISAAIVGAVLGFMPGMFLAYYFGCYEYADVFAYGDYEHLYVFAPAVVLGMLLAVLAIVASNKLFARISTQAHTLLALLLTLCAGAAIVGFFRMLP
jgi:hypothetical protein